MKSILSIIAFILPLTIAAQDYTVDLIPNDDSTAFTVLLNYEGEEFPRYVGVKTEAQILDITYNRIREMKRRQAILNAQTFQDEVNEQAILDEVEKFMVLDYQSTANAIFQNFFNGVYVYEVLGASVNVPVNIQGFEIRNANNNNLLATIAPQARNWITVTITGTGEVIQLYEVDGYFAGRNALNQVVTITPQ